MDFKQWFCLNQRESFTIDPKITSTLQKLAALASPV